MKKIIELKDVCYKYPDEEQNTINNINLSIYQGETVAIIGKNGSGKSTLVRLLNGLLEKSSGSIKISNIELNENNIYKIRNEIGMVFQNPDNQFVGSTVENDIAFGMENKGIPYKEMHRKVNDVLEKVSMIEFKDKEPAQLSGGQKQRVALAGVIAMDPQIVILDEATSMLDPKGKEEMLQLVTQFKKNYKTILTITHDLDEILMTDRVLVMDQGKIAFDVKPNNLFTTISNLDSYGLDSPFTEKLKTELKKLNIDVVDQYQTEGELLKWIQKSLNLIK